MTDRRDVIDGAKHELLMVEASALNMLNTIDELLDQVLDLEDELASLEQRNIELESIVEELNIQLAEARG